MTDQDVSSCLIVDRCVCMNVSLERMKHWADAQADDVSMDDLIEEFDCTRGCGMCRKYIEQMLRTGATRIPLDGRHR